MNGVTAATSKVLATGADIEVTQELALDPGENVIEVVAYNASNLLASLPARIMVSNDGATDIKKSKARKAIPLLDTCERGALVAGHTQSRINQPASEAAIGRLHEATGRPVLTAAASGKAAFEGYKSQGAFTWALLDASRNGDANANGTIELSELAAHVQNVVPKLGAELGSLARGWAVVGTATAGASRPLWLAGRGFRCGAPVAVGLTDARFGSISPLPSPSALGVLLPFREASPGNLCQNRLLSLGTVSHRVANCHQLLPPQQSRSFSLPRRRDYFPSCRAAPFSCSVTAGANHMAGISSRHRTPSGENRRRAVPPSS